MFNELHSLAHTCCSHSVAVCRYYCCCNVFSSRCGGRARPASSVRETTASLGCEGALGPRFVVRPGHVLCAWERVCSAVGECSVYTAGPVGPSCSGRLRLCWSSVRSPHLLRVECRVPAPAASSSVSLCSTSSFCFMFFSGSVVW